MKSNQLFPRHMTQNFLFNRRKVYFVYLTGEPTISPLDGGEEIRLATEEDTPLLVKMNRSQQVIESRFKKGCQAMLCLKDGEPVHMEWFSGRPFYVVDSSITLHPGSRGYYLFDLYTLPAYRGRSFWRRTMREIIDYLKRKEGQAFIFSAIDSTNQRALDLHLKNGFSHLGVLDFTQVCGVRRWAYYDLPSNFISTGWGYAGASDARLSCNSNSVRLKITHF